MHQIKLDEVTAQIHKLEQDSQRVLERLEKELPEKFSQINERISNCVEDRKRWECNFHYCNNLKKVVNHNCYRRLQNKFDEEESAVSRLSSNLENNVSKYSRRFRSDTEALRREIDRHKENFDEEPIGPLATTISIADHCKYSPNIMFFNQTCF